MQATPVHLAGNLTSIRPIPAPYYRFAVFPVLCWSIRWIYLGPWPSRRFLLC